MKKIVLLILLILCAVPALAQASSSDVYFYQSNTLCTFKIAISSGTSQGRLTATLRQGDSVVQQAFIDPGLSAELRLPLSNQWYAVTIEFNEADRDRYTIDTGLDCPPAPPTPTEDSYAAIEAETFKRMGWTQADIEWYWGIYKGVYGEAAAREYILGVAAGYGLIDTYVAEREAAADASPTETEIAPDLTATPEATAAP